MPVFEPFEYSLTTAANDLAVDDGRLGWFPIEQRLNPRKALVRGWA